MCYGTWQCQPLMFDLGTRNAWNPHLRETTLRIFASAGVSAQLGRFTRPLLDFTSVSARLDAGMTSQHTGAPL